LEEFNAFLKIKFLNGAIARHWTS